MTTLQQLEERGEARGLALGEARGLALGEARGRQAAAEMLLNLLTLRFQSVPEDARTKIARADVATLQRWGALVMTAPSVDAVLAG